MTPDNQETQIARRIAGAVRNRNIALDPKAAAILSAPDVVSKITVPDAGKAEIQGNEGKLILFVLDTSASMKNHAEAVRNGYNGLIGRMKENPASLRTTLIHTTDIYGNVINPLSILAEAVGLDSRNYSASGSSTPLRDSLVTASGQLTHELQRQFNLYKGLNGMVMVLTDGVDNSSKHTLEQTRIVIDSVRKTGNNLFIGAGVGDRATYLKEFSALGIPDEFVISGTNAQDMFRLIGEVTVAADNPASFRALAVRGLPVARRG